MRIFDTFLFFNEVELLELRLNTLDAVVDTFVITEATTTFSGKPKPLYFSENRGSFRKFESKIIHNVIDNTPGNFESFIPPHAYFTRRDASYPHKSQGVPLSRLSLDFQREVYQRDSIMNGLLGVARDDDLVIISDLDEIPNPHAVQQVIKSNAPGEVYNFCQRWYMYYLNVACANEWFGTRMCHFATLKEQSVDLMRHHLEKRSEQPGPIIEDGGWHFSFLGGHDRVRQKLAAYSYQGRRSKIFLQLIDATFPDRIRKKIANNEDIFNTGRQFATVQLDESFPQYLLENRGKFARLLKA